MTPAGCELKEGREKRRHTAMWRDRTKKISTMRRTLLDNKLGIA